MKNAVGLDHMIHPIAVDAFVRDYWEQAPLHVAREHPLHFDQVLNLADVDASIATIPPRDPQVRLARNGRSYSTSDLALTTEASGLVAEAVYAEHRSGATIILEALDERWPPLERLTNAVGRDISARAQANVYLTPAGSQGFGAHFDTHDVFVLQAAGSKTWRLYGSTPVLPFRRDAAPVSTDDLGEPEQEIVLSAGDTLYLPRGQVHDAIAQDATSLHITVGVHTMTWAHLFRLAVDRATQDESEFRRSLPLGFADSGALLGEATETFSNLLDKLSDMLSPETTVLDAAELGRAGLRADLKGHLLDLQTIDGIGIDTRLRRRQGVNFTITASPLTVSLTFNGKTIDLPRHVHEPLEFVCGAREFSAADLPGDLDEAGRVVLVSELLREGFLTQHQPTGTARQQTG